MDIYGYNNTIPNPLLTTSSSSTVSSTTTSLPSQATNNVQATSASSQASSSQSLAPTSSTSTASAASTAASWSYFGCWTDAVGSRSLGYQITGNANIMTTELCMSECASAGYTLAGLEYYSECYCDTQIRNGGALTTDPTTCNTACNVSCFALLNSSRTGTDSVRRETPVKRVVVGTGYLSFALARALVAAAAVPPYCRPLRAQLSTPQLGLPHLHHPQYRPRLLQHPGISLAATLTLLEREL